MLANKKQCTSCMACYAICPNHAINIKIDDKGFYMPYIDEEKCNGCGLCHNICPIINVERQSYNELIEQRIYACTNNDEKARIESSSGGIFAVLADYVIENNGYVCGALLNDDLTLNHVVSKDEQKIQKMRGSKYIQSNIGNCHNEIKNILEQNIMVLFCGTPCQCAGLNSFLGKSYTNLVVIDLLCTCVNPTYLLKDYLRSQMGDNFSKIIKIDFRDKIAGWGGNPRAAFSFSVEWLDKNGNIRKFYENVEENLFFAGFLGHLWMKESCNNCSFSKQKRISDFTIGDFWCINYYNKDLNDNKGLSFVMLNSAKSNEIFKKIRNKLNICQKVNDFKWAINTQSVLNGEGMRKHVNTDLFFKYAPAHYSKMELTKDLLGINKVGIMTLDFSVNYGAHLQTWAFCEKVKELGFTPKIIHWGEHHINTLGFEDDKMKPFRDKYFSRSEICYTEDELIAQTSDCNKIIIGGDQVFRNWNSSKDLPILRYLGDFVYGNKTLGNYGSSFGVDFFNGNEFLKNECKKLFKRFDKVSVREQTGAEILKHTFDIEAEKVLDPVFLVDEHKFSNLLNDCNLENTKEDYIAYMYLQDNFGLNKINKTLLSNLKNEKFININSDKNMEYNSVEQWLSYIKNAKFVITDSFHCVAISIIFKKPFIVVNRSWGGNSRIKDLLEKFDLQFLRKNSIKDITSEDLNVDINWTSVFEILNKEKQHSEKYLIELLLMKPMYKEKYKNEELKNYRIKNELVYKNNKTRKYKENIEKQMNLYNKELNTVKQELCLLSNKNLIRRRYCKYRILSKILFGKKRKHYKEKANLYKEKINQIQNIMENC